MQDGSSRFGHLRRTDTTGLLDDRLPPDVETAPTGSAGALTNAARIRAPATWTVILERRADHVMLIVEDDGVGFDAGEPGLRSHGFGLLGMQERASLRRGDTCRSNRRPVRATDIPYGWCPDAGDPTGGPEHA